LNQEGQSKAGDYGSIVEVSADDTTESSETKDPFAFLGDSFLSKFGETVGRDSIDGKTIGLYFSADWCSACRVSRIQVQ
jgi:hypothetical protein